MDLGEKLYFRFSGFNNLFVRRPVFDSRIEFLEMMIGVVTNGVLNGTG